MRGQRTEGGALMPAKRTRTRTRTIIKHAAPPDLSVLVGTLKGMLEQHIEATDRDRTQRAEDRDAAAEHREKVSKKLDSLHDAVAVIPTIEDRLKAAERQTKHYASLRERITGGRLAFAGAISALGFFFGGDLKAALFHLLTSKG
jgi:hypothetical protein